MINIFIKHFVHGTTAKKVTPTDLLSIIEDWTNGKDIVVEGQKFEHKFVESIRLTQ